MGDPAGTSFFATATVVKDAVFSTDSQRSSHNTPRQQDRAGTPKHFNFLQSQLQSPRQPPLPSLTTSSAYLSAQSSSEEIDPRLGTDSAASTSVSGRAMQLLETDIFEVALGPAEPAYHSPSAPLQALEEEEWSEVDSESEWQNAFGDDVQVLSFIGRGAFGCVYKALWRDELIAMKVIEHDTLEGVLETGHSQASYSMGGYATPRACAAPEAHLEAAVASAVQHANIVQTYDYQLVGSAEDEDGGPLRETRIMMEFCDLGSLEEAIAQGRFWADPPGGSPPRSNLAIVGLTLLDVAAALDHLHQLRITHRDLKAKNILLQSAQEDPRGFVAKVSDFGLSMMLPEGSSYDQIASSIHRSGTVTHMAPEVLKDGAVSQAADIYAYGILMFELYTGRQPYGRMNKVQVMLGVVTQSMRPQFPGHTPPWYAELAAACWAADPLERPCAMEVVEYLHAQLGAL